MASRSYGVASLTLLVCCCGSANSQQSIGCGTDSQFAIGKTTTVSIGGLNHEVSVPAAYNNSNALPVLLTFHGWGGTASECGLPCTRDIPANQIVSVSLSGYVGSWNGVGTTNSPGVDGATCTQEAGDYCSSDCNASCTDNCWWTTCKDSVALTIAVLDQIESSLCINTSNVYATGCSNGGMFMFELASDARIASRIAGIFPVVGLPHNGFNKPPAVKGMHLFGMYGKQDKTIPPLSNTDDPTKSYDTDSPGWFYSTARNVTNLWSNYSFCTEINANEAAYNIGDYNQLTCVRHSGCEGGAEIVECLFDGGHVCYNDYQVWPMLAFLLNHSGLPPPQKTSNGVDLDEEAVGIVIGIMCGVMFGVVIIGFLFKDDIKKKCAGFRQL